MDDREVRSTSMLLGCWWDENVRCGMMYKLWLGVILAQRIEAELLSIPQRSNEHFIVEGLHGARGRSMLFRKLACRIV